jgi:hypothetical protein
LTGQEKSVYGDTFAMAAQIFAEMLGMVCHKEYIAYQEDQTVITPFAPQLDLSDCH